MKKGTLTITQVRALMREVGVEAEQGLCAAKDYNDHRYASGCLSGSKSMLHSVLIAAGMRSTSSPDPLYYEFDAWWIAMDELSLFHLHRIMESRR